MTNNQESENTGQASLANALSSVADQLSDARQDAKELWLSQPSPNAEFWQGMMRAYGNAASDIRRAIEEAGA